MNKTMIKPLFRGIPSESISDISSESNSDSSDNEIQLPFKYSKRSQLNESISDKSTSNSESDEKSPIYRPAKHRVVNKSILLKSLLGSPRNLKSDQTNRKSNHSFPLKQVSKVPSSSSSSSSNQIVSKSRVGIDASPDSNQERKEFHHISRKRCRPVNGIVSLNRSQIIESKQEHQHERENELDNEIVPMITSSNMVSANENQSSYNYVQDLNNSTITNKLTIIEDSIKSTSNLNKSEDVAVHKVTKSQIKSTVTSTIPVSIPISFHPTPLRDTPISPNFKSLSKLHPQSNNYVSDQDLLTIWRNRIWPSKALLSFARVLLRSNPVASTDSQGHTHIILQPNWDEKSFQSISSTFSSVTAHNATFFMLLVEECRESLSVDDGSSSSNNTTTIIEDSIMETNPLDRDKVSFSLQADVVGIISQSDRGGLPQPTCDTRHCIVNTYRFSIVPDEKESKYLSNSIELVSGDVVLLSNSSWSRFILGLVQVWDPDHDIGFGANTGSRSVISSNVTSRNRSNSFTGSVADTFNGIDYVNIMICCEDVSTTTDSSFTTSSLRHLGGWASPGMVMNGIRCNLTVIGNALTFIREAQALISLRYISKPLQDIVLGIQSKISNPSSSSRSRSNSIKSIHQINGNKSSSGNNNISNSNSNSSISITPIENSSEIKKYCPLLWSELKNRYNSSQLKAMESIFDKNSKSESNISLLQGPPGTGKTYTILGILAVLLTDIQSTSTIGSKVIIGSSLRSNITSSELRNQNATISIKKSRILVCAPSNTAIDELVYRLHTQGILGMDGRKKSNLKIVRIGIPGGNRSISSHSHGYNHHNHHKRNQDSKESGEDFHSAIIRISEVHSLDYLVEEKRKGLVSEMKSYRYGVNEKTWMSNTDIRKTILDQADIVCCTLSGAGSQPIIEVVLKLTGFKFDAVIIDEAAQATEPSALIPLKYDPKTVVIVGDPCQLPAVIVSRVNKEVNYQQSLFERLTLAGHPVLMLDTQYRMHPMIAEYSSQRFYNGNLITDSKLISSKSHEKPYHRCYLFQPFTFHDISYGKQVLVGNSISNRDEADYIITIFEDLKSRYRNIDVSGIGVIAPYSAQRRLLKSLFRDKYGRDCEVEISTVDGFQGREKDIIIFSCVRAPNKKRENEIIGSNMPTGIGFLKEQQRLNVAITRAKYAVWIIGCRDILSSDMEWNQLINFCDQKHCIVTPDKGATINNNSQDQSGKYSKIKKENTK